MGNCGTHFCFLCGEPAGPDSRHWRIGRPCPLYRRAGEANAQYVGQNADPAPLQDERGIGRALIEEIATEMREFDPQENEPAEVLLRRSDRLWLAELGDRISHENDATAGQQPAAWHGPLQSLLPILQVLVGYYTIHVEEDEDVQEHKRMSLVGTLFLLAPFLAALPAGTVERFPRLSIIVRSIMAGVAGEDMTAHVAERLADDADE